MLDLRQDVFTMSTAILLDLPEILYQRLVSAKSSGLEASHASSGIVGGY